MKNLESEALTQDYLKKLLHYNPLTGIFTWIERPLKMFMHCKNPQRACNTWNTRFSNKIAGNEYKNRKAKTSYIDIRITIKGKTKLYSAHRLVFLYLNGRFPLEDVDHIDGNGLNNREINLREVSRQENNKNMPMYSNNKSGYTGVWWDKKYQKWEARIVINRKKIYGGCFDNIEDAVAKRKEMEIEHGYHKNHGRRS